MKDGRTHLAYKAEHAMDLQTGAMVSAVIHSADKGDTDTVWNTMAEAGENLQTVQERCEAQEEILQELVADKGYHSNAVLVGLEEVGVRSYISEPERGRRRWRGEQGVRERVAVYGNRRRIQRAKGSLLQRLRAEILERSFAHMLETGGMRRVWLRGLENVWKRYLIHACGFKVSALS
jgi:transposase